jgi:hypothetical protein
MDEKNGKNTHQRIVAGRRILGILEEITIHQPQGDTTVDIPLLLGLPLP